MLIALHKQARATPAVRAEIAASTELVAKLKHLPDSPFVAAAAR